MSYQKCDICGVHRECTRLGDDTNTYLVVCTECNTIDVVECMLDGLPIHSTSDELEVIKDTIRMAEVLNALDEEVN